MVLFFVGNIIAKLHFLVVELNFKYKRFGTMITPSVHRNKLEAICKRRCPHANEPHFDLEGNVSITPEKLLAVQRAGIKSVSNTHDPHNDFVRESFVIVRAF